MYIYMASHPIYSFHVTNDGFELTPFKFCDISPVYVAAKWCYN